MEEINEGEIVYSSLKLRDNNNKEYYLRKVVFSREWESEYPFLSQKIYNRFLKQHNVTKKVDGKAIVLDATVVDVIIHARTGYKHRLKGFTTAKKNEQKRDDVTGAYV
tara:strand:- start:339 stop:662 length:324 start_codon:yes stop_codon:yes gene_type:complete